MRNYVAFFHFILNIILMFKITITSAIFLLAALSTTSTLQAHCQVPCGIYTDDTVLTDLHTHQTTIAKAMVKINELQADSKNTNQVVRWVMNKEDHAKKIQDTMTHYFLAQRIKLAEAESNEKSYLKKVTLAHKIIVLAMKCKQSTDTEVAKKLHAAIDAFAKAYSGK